MPAPREKIVYQNPDGTINVVHLTGELPLAQVIARAVPDGTSYVVVDKAQIPANRKLRKAWRLQGNNVVVDRVVAEEVVLDRLREHRKPRLADNDALYMAALKAGADTSTVISEYNALLDVTKADLSGLSITQLQTLTLDEALALPKVSAAVAAMRRP